MQRAARSLNHEVVDERAINRKRLSTNAGRAGHEILVAHLGDVAPKGTNERGTEVVAPHLGRTDPPTPACGLEPPTLPSRD